MADQEGGMAINQNRVASVGRQAGFTLIELMITVAVIAILMAVALPSYQQHVVRSNRAAVEAFMLEASNKQERYLLDNRSYAGSLSALGMSEGAEIDSNYNVSVSNAGTGLVYTITATPINSQLSRDTECGVLKLDNLGAKSAAGGGQRCWR